MDHPYRRWLTTTTAGRDLSSQTLGR